MTSRYISCTPKKSGMKALHRFFRLWIWSSHNKILLKLDDNHPSESGQWASLIWNWEEGKKTQLTPAWNRENRNHNFWRQWKWKKWRAQQFCSNWAIYILWSFACYPPWRRFFHWIASPNWSFNSVIWQNPRLKFVFRMCSCPWDL